MPLYDFWIDPAGGLSGLKQYNPSLRQCGRCERVTMATDSMCICGYEGAHKSHSVPEEMIRMVDPETVQLSRFGVAGEGDCKPRAAGVIYPACSFGQNIPLTILSA